MTELLIANIGSYPRIGEEKDQQRLRRALGHLQNKDISSHAFHDVEQSVVQEIVREQISADLDEVTSGHITWHDPAFHFCRKVAGIKRAGLARFFDTNTYYRVPLFTGKPRRKASAVLGDYIFAQSISNRPIRTVLTGPYTLARLSDSDMSPFKRLPARLSFFTGLIKSEVGALVEQGAKFIQIDEPAIARFPEDMNLFRKAIESLSEAVRPARFILTFYFSPLAPIYHHLKTLPVDVLNLDFTTDGKKLWEKLEQSPPSMPLGLGLINGRNTRMEAIDPILKTLKNWMTKNPQKFLYLTPSCGLGHLPRHHAFEKLKLMAKIKVEMSRYLQKEPHHG